VGARLPRGRVRDASARPGHRWPRLLPGAHRGPRRRLHADRRRAGQSVHPGIHIEELAPRRLVAPRRGAGIPRERDPADQAGLLRFGTLNIVPLVLYAAAGAAYAVHFASRQAAAGRMATTLLILAVLAHTFVIGMQTMEVGHVPFANPSRAISTSVWL